MAIKKSTNNKWRGCGEKGTLLQCRWECKLAQPLWRKVWRLLKKVRIELPYDPVIPLLGTYHEKTMAWKDTSAPAFIAALFTIAETPSTDEWEKKMWCVYTYSGILVIKKNEIMPLAAKWMDPEMIILSRVSQTNTIWYHFCVESKIWHKRTYLQNRQTHRHKKQTCDNQSGQRGGLN